MELIEEVEDDNQQSSENNYITKEEDEQKTELLDTKAVFDYSGVQEEAVDDGSTNTKLINSDKEDVINETDEVMNEDHVNSEEQTKYSATGRPRRTNAGQGVERLEMSFGGKEYVILNAQQFTMKWVSENTNIEELDKVSYHGVAVNTVFT